MIVLFKKLALCIFCTLLWTLIVWAFGFTFQQGFGMGMYVMTSITIGYIAYSYPVDGVKY